MVVPVATSAELSDACLGAAVELITRTLEPAAILLFGSAAGDRLRADSDVDLAVLLGHLSPDAFALASLRTDLAELLGRDVDLAVLDTASPILAMEVLRRHRLLANPRPEVLRRFTVRTLGSYFDLKRVRRPIEESLQRQAGRT